MTGPAIEYSAQDHARMTRALELAEATLNACDPNPRVGCVVESGGRIAGEAGHRRAGEAHAEILALRDAGDRARDATVYVTLEPCCHTGRTGPCVDALIEAGVGRVVAAMHDPNPRVGGGGLEALRAAGIDVSVGLLAERAQALNRGFVSRMTRGRPFVRSKIAASLDGRVALADGESKWITSEAARADVQQLRARASAILTGAATVIADDPRMTVRLPEDGRWQPPLRVILDSRLRTAIGARILDDTAPTLIVAAADAPAERVSALQASGARIKTVPKTGAGLDLAAVLALLADEEINEVLVEAGPTLNGALLRGGCLDELVVYQAPLLLGPDAMPMFRIPPLSDMSERPVFDLRSMQRIGPDWRLVFVPGSV